MFGVVEWICITNSDKSAKIPDVVKLINSKWDTLGYPLFLSYFVIWFILCILITAIVVYDNNTPSPHPHNNSQLIMTIIFPCVLFLLVVIAIIELPSILIYGLEYYGLLGKRIRGAARMNKILTTITIILFITLCFYKLFEYRESLDNNNNPFIGSNNNNNNTSSNHIPTISPTTVIPLQPVVSNAYDPSIYNTWYNDVKKCEVLLVIIAWLNIYYFFMGFDWTGKLRYF